MSLETARNAAAVQAASFFSQHEPTESKSAVLVSRDSIPVVHSAAAPGKLFAAEACEDVRLVNQYLCWHPELFGGAKIQDPKDFGHAHGLDFTPEGDHFIVRIEKYTFSEKFNGKPTEYLPDTHVISRDQFTSYLALQKEAQKTEEDIKFLLYFLQSHQNELARITKANTAYGTYSCEIAKQPDATFLITATSYTVISHKFSCSLLKTQFEELIAQAKKTLEEEEKQKNIQLVCNYLESHPAHLGIKTRKEPNGGHFSITCTIQPRPDGGYDLKASCRIYDRHLCFSGLDLEENPSWRSFRRDISFTKDGFAKCLADAKASKAKSTA